MGYLFLRFLVVFVSYFARIRATANTAAPMRKPSMAIPTTVLVCYISII